MKTREDAIKYLEKRWEIEFWFCDLLSDLTKMTHDNYPNSIFYVDKCGNIYMEHRKDDKYLWIDYYTVWERVFGWKFGIPNFTKEDSLSLSNHLMSEHMGIDGVEMNFNSIRKNVWVNMNIVTVNKDTNTEYNKLV